MTEDPAITDTLTVTQDASRCQLLPQLGGSLAAWSVCGQEMLRPAGAEAVAARDPYGTAGFPLVPFSNRVGAGRFEWNGEVINLAPNFLPEPHAIHGVGFERPWQIETRSGNAVQLAFKHRPDASWPWAFEARQRITVGDDSLTIDLSATNLELRPVPLSFGYHPYIPRQGARLTFYAQSVWSVGADGLPIEADAPSGALDFSKGAAVERADIDHCYCGWGRAAYITWPDKAHTLEITATPELPCVVVYARANLHEFCVEPVAHMNNALNWRDPKWAIPVAAPEESFSARIRFRAIRR